MVEGAGLDKVSFPELELVFAYEYLGAAPLGQDPIRKGFGGEERLADRRALGSRK